MGPTCECHLIVIAQVDCYLIKDAEEVQLKTRVWEEMNREYIEKQART